MRGAAVALAAVVMTAALGGCSASSDGGSGPGGAADPELSIPTLVDPCTLVTQSEAETALGAPTRACRSQGDQFSQWGQYLGAGDIGSVEITLGVGNRAQYDQLKQEASSTAEFVEITGLGDGAFFSRPFTDAKVLVLSGMILMEISVGAVTGPAPKENAVTLARTALSRLSTG